jgi:Tfp pilus assembly PilM family ATPase
MGPNVLKKAAHANIHLAGMFAKVVSIATYLSARARIPTNVRDPAGMVENAVMMNVDFYIPTRV